MPILLSRDEFDIAMKGLNERLDKNKWDLKEDFHLKYDALERVILDHPFFKIIDEKLGRIEQALIELKPCKCEEKEVKKVIPLKKK